MQSKYSVWNWNSQTKINKNMWDNFRLIEVINDTDKHTTALNDRM